MARERQLTNMAGAGILVTGVAVLVVGMIRGESSIRAYIDLLRSQEVMEKAVFNLEAENEALHSEINKIRSSAEYARKVLKDKYHLTEENETILFYADE